MAEPLASRDRLSTIDRLRRVFIHSLNLNIRAEDLPEESRLEEAAGLDSIAVLEFVAAIEQEFDIEIEPEFLDLNFLGDLRRLASHVDDLAKRSGPRNVA